MQRTLRNIALFMALPAALQAGFLGVSGLEPVTDKDHPDAGLAAGQVGLLIGGVLPDGPAAQAGLKGGDILLEVDGHAATDPDKFVKEIRAMKADRKIVVRYLRDGSAQETTVALGTPPAPGSGPRPGILDQKAPAWKIDAWRNLPQGKESIDVSDFKGKVLYVFCFQSW